MRELKLSLSSEDLDAIAERAAELVLERSSNGDQWMAGAEAAANYIDAPPSRVYSLVCAKRIPFHKDGSRLMFLRSELDAWIKSGGGTRP